jgi:hypothetical protein
MGTRNRLFAPAPEETSAAGRGSGEITRTISPDLCLASLGCTFYSDRCLLICVYMDSFMRSPLLQPKRTTGAVKITKTEPESRQTHHRGGTRLRVTHIYMKKYLPPPPVDPHADAARQAGRARRTSPRTTGLSVPDEFVVAYGRDYAEAHAICVHRLLKTGNYRKYGRPEIAADRARTAAGAESERVSPRPAVQINPYGCRAAIGSRTTGCEVNP